MIRDGQKDIYFTEDGDFYLNSKNKKVHLVGKEDNELIESLIRKRIQSNSRDWRINNVIASNIDVYRGMPRRSEIIEEIKISLVTAISEDGLVDPRNININVIGLRENVIGIGIVINGIEASVDDTVTFKIMYDFRENKFVPLDMVGVFN
jgi:hypothetical protein